ncbi:MAG: thiamine-phosphate kinase [Candidatus Omnitrophota bacterium]|nr:thiamine-phosphate kinase [Candidatus Omnitrophota bacterium]MBU1928590.1 thiamine-phosphate kinase [Candidatus Omnitrophota bacterium]MBU2034603.1 thiamine-phosphate kinase [Candidatus Omnitrophota bacterium]MBU2221974.1 thiamine-phosphate kinase [Candidatus Omnitrophota bacterium]MBU2257899.1 thiamine-phosphate kinase [Candidatus Omnitrophota bacterium]
MNLSLSKIGEFGLIHRIKRLIRTDNSVVQGIGDDCAVIKFNQREYLLLTCDMLVEGVDFRSQEDPYLIGRKSLAVSMSDIASCGGMPRYALISLGIPKNKKIKFIDGLYKGIRDLAKVYSLNIIGGDISRSEKLVIDVSLIGLVEKNNLVLRSGAKLKDIIMVSAALGGSIKGRHLRFSPRIKEARFLVNSFKLNSMIDISDGLTLDLSHVLEESDKGAVIYQDLIPLSRDCSGLEDALTSGEDFELLFTLSIKEARRLLSVNDSFFPIGHITGKKEGLVLIDRLGNPRKIKVKGYTHF